jgi:hypothetical protein
MDGSSDRSRPWIRGFAAPILLAAMTLAGLVAALLWGEIGKCVAWVTVGAPIAVIAGVLLRRALTKRRNSASAHASHSLKDTPDALLAQGGETDPDRPCWRSRSAP